MGGNVYLQLESWVFGRLMANVELKTYSTQAAPLKNVYDLYVRRKDEIYNDLNGNAPRVIGHNLMMIR